MNPSLGPFGIACIAFTLGTLGDVSGLDVPAFLSAALLEFGFVALVGHIVVLGILAVLVLDRIDPPRRVPRSPPWTVAALFLGSCVAVIATYHGLVWAFHA